MPADYKMHFGMRFIVAWARGVHTCHSGFARNKHIILFCKHTCLR